MDIQFRTVQHKEAYNEYTLKSKIDDSYHRSLFYTLAIDDECRQHINEIYDFEEQCIIPESLDKPWHTNSSFKTELLAFNLYNGYVDELAPELSSPFELFACNYNQYFGEAIKIRFRDYYNEREMPGHEESEMPITEIDPDLANKIVESHSLNKERSAGRYLFEEYGSWTAIDDSTHNCWVEVFPDKKTATDWLNGKFEIDEYLEQKEKEKSNQRSR
ncbi:MAG: DUF6075 family protein [Erysipelotrichaceae bacterium]|nr:DUF6075 family protein [Erysipelotrichaceae bacterium]